MVQKDFSCMPITTINSLGPNQEVAVANPIFTTGFAGNATMSGGSNWFDTGNNYFGCEIHSATRLANSTTYFRVQGRLPTTLSGSTSNPTVWVLIVSHPTGTPTPGNTITIVSGWRFRLPDGANGDLFTVDFDSALESFGSDRTAATGNFYIGWAHTTLTGRGSLAGAYWVDTPEATAGYGQNQLLGTIYYQINPGTIDAGRTIAPANGPVARGLHWRFFPRVDYDISGVNTLQANNLRSTNSLRVDNKLAGVYELVNYTTWRSNTSAVNIAFQPQLYSHYKVFWDIRHGPSWNQTFLRFLDSANSAISAANYANSGYWLGAEQASPTFQNSYFGTANSYIWMAGNGNSWNSAGEAVIYTGDDYVTGLGVSRVATTGNRFPTVRGKSNLYNNGGTPWNYMEEFGGTYWGTTPVAGFQIYGSGGASGLGSVWVYGARYE
jgi:hypothetical protein